MAEPHPTVCMTVLISCSPKFIIIATVRESLWRLQECCNSWKNTESVLHFRDKSTEIMAPLKINSQTLITSINLELNHCFGYFLSYCLIPTSE